MYVYLQLRTSYVKYIFILLYFFHYDLKWISMSIGKSIKKARESKGLSQEKLEELTGIARTALSAYENDRQRPNLGTLETIAKALEIPISELIDFEETPARLEGYPIQGGYKNEDHLDVKFFGDDFIVIPVLTGSVSAGDFQQDFSHWNGRLLPVLKTNTKNKKLVAWKVHGKSMEPNYREGDFLIVDVEASARDGDKVIARRNGDEVTVKQYKVLKEGLIELRPYNPDYSTIQIKQGDHIDIVGVVFGVFRYEK